MLRSIQRALPKYGCKLVIVLTIGLLFPTSSYQVAAQAKPIKEVIAPEPSDILETLSVVATGYTAGKESTGKRPGHPQYGITYSGVKVRRDKQKISTIAADPRVLPLGTVLFIPGYGYGIVADTGSAIKGNKIDLYYKTTKQVYKEWGKKTLKVHVIKRGEGKVTEKLIHELNEAVIVHKIPKEVA